MYTNHLVQMACNNNTLPNKSLEYSLNNCKSVQFINKNVSIQSNEVSLYRNKGEYALLNADNCLSHIDIHSSVTHTECKRDKPLTITSKEPIRYINNKTCKKKFNYKAKNHIQKCIEELTSTEIKHVDKATYCRPIINLYNEQFLFKTMERNSRLKNLIKKMMMARQRERENVTWNNFINMLKNKHAVNDSNYPEDINEFYSKKLPPNNRSKLCAELLKNFYNHNYLENEHLIDKNDSHITNKYNLFNYGEDFICYPTSSQARLIMLNREQRQKQCRSNWGDHASDRNLYLNKRGLSDNNKFNFNLNVRKTSSAQTNMTPFKNFTQNLHKDKATDIVQELSKMCMNNKQSENYKNINKVSLQKVGDKLVSLIESINTFIDEIKLNKTTMKQNDLTSIICRCKAENKFDGKDATASTDIEKLNQRTGVNSCDNMPNSLSKIPKTDDTSKEVPSNSYQIEFEEPTRDCSTGLTKSFLNNPPAATGQNINKISTNHQERQNDNIFRQLTIAVNTDPLSFLALLRLSTDTIRSVLSCLPFLNYCQYLLSLPAGQYIGSEHHRYICTVCGAGFDNPSTLSDHIFEHKLGNARDCCVCRYVLDNVQRPVSLFRCKYCGKCFTRAYCFELHQNTCAKERGRDQDESSDLLLLR